MFVVKQVTRFSETGLIKFVLCADFFSRILTDSYFIVSLLFKYFFQADVDVISGTIGGNGPQEFDIETHSHPHSESVPSNDSDDDSIVIAEEPLKPFFHTPFFNDPFFNAFGFGFPGYGGPQSAPWWKG